MERHGVLAGIARGCDWINEQVGRRLMWLAALLVLVQFAVVLCAISSAPASSRCRRA
ncbi:MAG: hypothetical protein ACKOUS_10030 [Alphaproteobacteria bacterium]